MKFDFLFKNQPVNNEPDVEKKEETLQGKSTDGVLDMVIAFDTTGSMASYIGAVRKEVSELVPRLFKSNPNLRIGVVAFGDYCDMIDAHTFGKAYQCLMPTDNENDVIKFVMDSRAIFRKMATECVDEEMNAVMDSYMKECDGE